MSRANRYGAQYMLGVLMLVYVMNIADRQVLAIVAEPLKRAMNLTDGELGLLIGPAATLLYAGLSLPMAYLSDRIRRVPFLALCCASWSIITALGGLSGNVWQLGLTRLGVSIAEGGGTPASLSMISDVFPRTKRAMALSIWSSASSIGLFVGFGLGGLANDLVGWRGAFVAAGIPGLLMAFVVRLTLKEPIRGGAEAPINKPDSGQRLSFLNDILALLSIPIIRTTICAAALSNLVVFSLYAWGPSIAVRSFHAHTATVGLWMGAGLSVTGTCFALLAGYLIDRLNQRSTYASALLVAACQFLAIPAYVLAFLASDFRTFVAFLALAFGLTVTFGPYNLNVVQTHAPPIRRGMSAALTSLILAVVGPGIGVPAIGLLSDALKGQVGAQSLRDVVMVVLPTTALLSGLMHLVVVWVAREHPKVTAGEMLGRASY